MEFPVYLAIFYFFAALLIGSAVMVVASRHPERSVLFLVLSFFAAAVLWMLLRAEFLALMLIFVYVGAVMTLFLFVIMMLNIDQSRFREKFMRCLPIGIGAILLLIGLITWNALKAPSVSSLPLENPGISNTEQIGVLLYTDYCVAFEMAGLILLVAVIAAIALACRKGDQP